MTTGTDPDFPLTFAAAQEFFGEPATTVVTKVVENRLRRIAARRGYRLVKSARRDPLARDYGRYRLEILT
jgi:hypothetical protein